MERKLKFKSFSDVLEEAIKQRWGAKRKTSLMCTSINTKKSKIETLNFAKSQHKNTAACIADHRPVSLSQPIASEKNLKHYAKQTVKGWKPPLKKCREIIDRNAIETNVINTKLPDCNSENTDFYTNGAYSERNNLPMSTVNCEVEKYSKPVLDVHKNECDVNKVHTEMSNTLQSNKANILDDKEALKNTPLIIKQDDETLALEGATHISNAAQGNELECPLIITDACINVPSGCIQSCELNIEAQVLNGSKENNHLSEVIPNSAISVRAAEADNSTEIEENKAYSERGFSNHNTEADFKTQNVISLSQQSTQPFTLHRFNKNVDHLKNNVADEVGSDNIEIYLGSPKANISEFPSYLDSGSHIIKRNNMLHTNDLSNEEANTNFNSLSSAESILNKTAAIGNENILLYEKETQDAENSVSSSHELKGLYKEGSSKFRIFSPVISENEMTKGQVCCYTPEQIDVTGTVNLINCKEATNVENQINSDALFFEQDTAENEFVEAISVKYVENIKENENLKTVEEMHNINYMEEIKIDIIENPEDIASTDIAKYNGYCMEKSSKSREICTELTEHNCIQMDNCNNSKNFTEYSTIVLPVEPKIIQSKQSIDDKVHSATNENNNILMDIKNNPVSNTMNSYLSLERENNPELVTESTNSKGIDVFKRQDTTKDIHTQSSQNILKPDGKVCITDKLQKNGIDFKRNTETNSLFLKTEEVHIEMLKSSSTKLLTERANSDEGEFIICQNDEMSEKENVTNKNNITFLPFMVNTESLSLVDKEKAHTVSLTYMKAKLSEASDSMEIQESLHEVETTVYSLNKMQIEIPGEVKHPACFSNSTEDKPPATDLSYVTPETEDYYQPKTDNSLLQESLDGMKTSVHLLNEMQKNTSKDVKYSVCFNNKTKEDKLQATDLTSHVIVPETEEYHQPKNDNSALQESLDDVHLLNKTQKYAPTNFKYPNYFNIKTKKNNLQVIDLTSHVTVPETEENHQPKNDISALQESLDVETTVHLSHKMQKDTPKDVQYPEYFNNKTKEDRLQATDLKSHVAVPEIDQPKNDISALQESLNDIETTVHLLNKMQKDAPKDVQYPEYFNNKTKGDRLQATDLKSHLTVPETDQPKNDISALQESLNDEETTVYLSNKMQKDAPKDVQYPEYFNNKTKEDRLQATDLKSHFAVPEIEEYDQPKNDISALQESLDDIETTVYLLNKMRKDAPKYVKYPEYFNNKIKEVKLQVTDLTSHITVPETKDYDLPGNDSNVLNSSKAEQYTQFPNADILEKESVSLTLAENEHMNSTDYKQSENKETDSEASNILTATYGVTRNNTAEFSEMEDDLGLTASQILRIEDECQQKMFISETLPVQWTQKVKQSRKKVFAVIQELTRLNAMLKKVRKEVWLSYPNIKMGEDAGAGEEFKTMPQASTSYSNNKKLTTRPMKNIQRK